MSFADAHALIEAVKGAIKNNGHAVSLLSCARFNVILEIHVLVVALDCAVEHKHFETLEWLLKKDEAYAQTIFRATLERSSDSSVLSWLATKELRAASWLPDTFTLALTHPHDQYHMWLRPCVPEMVTRHTDVGDIDIMLPDSDLAVERFLGAFSPDEGAALFMRFFRGGRTRGFSRLMRGNITKMRAVALADGGKVLRAGWQRRGLARRWRACLRLTPSDLVSAGLRY
jgi:hypothetical protein